MFLMNLSDGARSLSKGRRCRRRKNLSPTLICTESAQTSFLFKSLRDCLSPEAHGITFKYLYGIDSVFTSRKLNNLPLNQGTVDVAIVLNENHIGFSVEKV